MNKQTAVEWLLNEFQEALKDYGGLDFEWLKRFEQAKELDKEQELKKWLEAWSLGYDRGFNNGVKKFKKK